MLEKPAASPRPRIYAALAMAASVLLVVGITLTRRQPAGTPAPTPQASTDNFIALPYSSDSLASAGSVVMQVEVPRSAVALAGVPVTGGPADELVKVEVVVGADGLARAIRLVN